MHQAQNYVDNHVKALSPGTKINVLTLNSSQASGLAQALKLDAADYAYSGVVSIADAVQAVERSLYTWATVKLYYSVFYMTRALLAAHGTALIYENSKPYSWSSVAGAVPIKRDGPTHKVVLSSFKLVLPNSPLVSQMIGLKEPLEWLMERREEVNYKNSKFSEPDAPEHFNFIAKNGIRRSISAYVKDSKYLYAFDPEHAILALPIEALKLLLKPKISGGGDNPLLGVNRKYLASLYGDRAGPLTEIVSLLNP
jgi:hypothetical protein